LSEILGFGESMAGYEVPVLNEREVRAAAGILFLFALVSFMNSWLMGNFRLTRIFVIAFLIDGQYRHKGKDGSMLEFVNFPAIEGAPPGVRDKWTTSDVQAVLTARMRKAP